MMAPTARKLCVNLSLFCMRTQKRERDTKHRENRLFVQGCVSARNGGEKERFRKAENSRNAGAEPKDIEKTHNRR